MAFDANDPEWQNVLRESQKRLDAMHAANMKAAKQILRERDGRKSPAAWLWGVAERADWSGWPPRKFWSWMLRRMDRAHGHQFTYDEK